MAIERRDVFSELTSLREAMDRLLGDGFAWPRQDGGNAPAGTIKLDLIDKNDAIEVRAEIPGMKPEEINVTVHGDRLVVKGEHKDESERKEDNWIIRERHSGAVSRTVRLPSPVDSDKSQAQYRDGVLTLTLPKREDGKSRQIKIQS